MNRMIAAALILATALSGCVQPQVEERPGVHFITLREAAEIPGRHVESVNAERIALGLEAVRQDPTLMAAARAHASDMSLQARPWHFGSDGSSPLDRVTRAGYRGHLIGENIAETFENDLQILEAWLRDPDFRATILNPDARDIGIGWHQDPGGKLWWTQLIGGG